ncbi:hypothetical protein SAMN04487916_102181 [Arthrobacter sp. ov407]|uniref:hypothetical protein n=1 Tax=Arthrobacter sp. ov407 TaxID=1761748 RepID=UPI000888D252|nr:hypothetical protein [Arthrobacter sp. ov407]SDK69161.1 hypothetical protein SAMN04487916_102181 [Arthrobacter sp. ov407]
MFFWIIVLSFLIPVAMRLYRRSVRGRNQGTPGQFGPFPGSQNNPGNQNNQPRDGYTQQDYFGGFGQLGAPKQPGPANQPYPNQPYPDQQYPNAQYPSPRFPNQPFPSEPYPGQQYPGPAGYQSPVPYEDSPEYLNNPPQPQRQAPPTAPAPAAGQPQAPQTPQPPAAAQGYRARKLAELDQQYSDGKLSMEDYMAQRAEIMKG